MLIAKNIWWETDMLMWKMLWAASRVDMCALQIFIIIIIIIINITGCIICFTLTSSHRMPYKPEIFCWDGRSVSVYTRIPIFVCFAGRLVSTPRMTCHHGDWRVYTPSFLGVPGVTVGWPRTKGTASNERVHSFCGFLPNPFIQDLCLEFVKTDLYHCHLSLECRLFDRALVDNRPLLRSLPTV